MIHRAMKAEGEPSLFRHGGVGDHGVARRAADSFADAIHEAQAEHLIPTGRQPQERAHGARQRVAEDDQPFATPAPVAEVSTEEFEQA